MTNTSQDTSLTETRVDSTIEAKDDSSTFTRELYLLEEIERDPDITQASLATQLGVAVGTVNWLLKRFVDKGYVKVKRLQRRKLRYIITPEGLAFRARLTLNYIDTSLRLYRRVRDQVRQHLREVKSAGYSQVVIQGDGDLADICKLTCLEYDLTPIMYTDLQPVGIVEEHSSSNLNKIPPSSSHNSASTTERMDPPHENLGHLPVLRIYGTRVSLSMKRHKDE